jgi:hypothetical protein
MMAQHPIEIIPFTVPNQVVLRMPPMPKQAGPRAAPTLRLADVNLHTLEQMIADFGAAVLAEQRRQIMEDQGLPERRA